MFVQRARGRSVASLVRELNERGVPCPSSADPRRNGHRSGERWIVRTVAIDPGEPALHRPAGVEPAQHSGPRQRRPAKWPRLRSSSVEPGGGVGGLRRTHSYSAGRRRHIPGHPMHPVEQADKGWSHPPLPARGTCGVRGLQSTDGRALDLRARRIALPARLHQCQASSRRCAPQRLPPRRSTHRAYPAYSPRSAPGGQRRTEVPCQNPVDVLRHERFQIICADQGATLRRESSPEPTSPAIEPVQTAFELVWNSQAVVDQGGTLSINAHGSI
jgi:hypothetical protein